MKSIITSSIYDLRMGYFNFQIREPDAMCVWDIQREKAIWEGEPVSIYFSPTVPLHLTHSHTHMYIYIIYSSI